MTAEERLSEERRIRTAMWLVFVVAMFAISVPFAACNITPLLMRERGACWSEQHLQYEQCAQPQVEGKQ